MATTVTLASGWVELDDRTADAGAISVGLLWHRETNRQIVEVQDRRTGEALHIEPQPGQRAYPDIFNHPYAYTDQAWESQSLPRGY